MLNRTTGSTGSLYLHHTQHTNLAPNSVSTYLTFFLIDVLFPHHRASCLDLFLFTLLNFTSFSFRLSPLFPPHFHFVFFLGITEFELYLYVLDFQRIKPDKDPIFLFICSLTSINFTSVSSTQILISIKVELSTGPCQPQ